jgi:hypothetical protein
VPEEIVPSGLTLPDAFKLTDFSAGYVQNTNLELLANDI